jgi:NTP pyrophosphatase (non-canonical NTP hydrolase)
MTTNKLKKPSIVVSGSFRKHFEGISRVIKEFENLGIQVLSPKPSKIMNPEHEFVILETDNTDDQKTLEQRHLEAIEKADALYLYNLDGYIGASTTLELGWAIALGKPIYSKEQSKDFTLKFFSGKIATPNEIQTELLENQHNLINTINNRSSVEKLQNYIHDVIVQRGFDNETPADIMLLMVEEVGELAKALRKYTGLKIDQAKKDKYVQLEHELADVFIYLLDLANVCKVDLFQALKEKERENNKRFWDK